MPSARDPSAAVPRPADRRRERLWTAGVALFAAALYLATLAPTIYTQDAPELTAVVASWGVAHPPGYPLFTMVYGLIVRALPFGDVALRTNVVTALIAAGTIGVLHRVGHAIGASCAGAAAGALGVAVARDWWRQGIATEVYALDGLLLACALLATIRVARAPAGARGWAWLGLAYGLACGHRGVNVLFLLALLAWVETARRRARVPWTRYGRFVAAGAATTLVWVYLVVAAAADPAIGTGDPSTPGRLWDVISGAAYARHFASTQASLVGQRALWLATSLPAQLAATAAAAVAGALLLRRRTADATCSAWWALIAFLLANLAFVAIYNVPDGDSLLQPTWVATAALAAAGFDGLRARLPRGGALVVVALALAPATWTYGHVDLSGVRTVEQLGPELFATASPGSLVLAFDDTARGAMQYEQVVHGRRRDVAVVDPSAPFAWQLKTIRRRAPAFDPGDARGDGWLRAAALLTLHDERRGLFSTDPLDDAQIAYLLGRDVAEQVVTVPTGLLYRLLLPRAPDEAQALASRVTAEADAAFWPGREIPATPRAFDDAQLALLPLRSARARFLLAVTYVGEGRVDAAVPHLAAVGASGVDPLESVVIEHFSRVGPAAPRQNLAARCRRALQMLDSGIPPGELLGVLAPR